MAENASKQLVYNKKQKLQEKRNNLSQAFYDYLLDGCDKTLVKLLKDEKTKGFIKSSSSVKIISGCGFSWDNVGLIDSLPSWFGNTFQIQFDNNDKKGIELFKLFTEVKELKQKVEKLEEDIIITLMNLKTLKRVQVEFPEAVQFLPSNETTALSVDIKPIREALKDK